MTDVVTVATISGYRFTPKNKALQLQVTGAESADGQSSDTGFSDAFGDWCVVAPPPAREVDATGATIGACEALVATMGDQHAIIGTRDVRVAKYGQDVKPGEVAFINAWGSRIYLGEKVAAWNMGGGFIAFDSVAKTVALAGMPATAGAGVPYISISPEVLGLVSATGKASVSVAAGNVTIAATTVVIDGATVSIGKGAVESIMTYSQLISFVAQINTALEAMTPPRGPIVMPPPGRRILVPRGG